MPYGSGTLQVRAMTHGTVRPNVRICTDSAKKCVKFTFVRTPSVRAFLRSARGIVCLGVLNRLAKLGTSYVAMLGDLYWHALEGTVRC